MVFYEKSIFMKKIIFPYGFFAKLIGVIFKESFWVKGTLRL